jgi:hypothetical protein
MNAIFGKGSEGIISMITEEMTKFGKAKCLGNTICTYLSSFRLDFSNSLSKVGYLLD